jgi:N-methylhydantoinase B
MSISFSVEARHLGQAWDIKVPLPENPSFDAAAVETLVARFRETHNELFAVSDPAAVIEFLTWGARVECRINADDTVAPAFHFGEERKPAERFTYFSGHGWLEAAVRDFLSLAGPARRTGDRGIPLYDRGAAARLLGRLKPRRRPRDRPQPRMSGPMTEQPTAIQLAIFNARMESVTRRMANTLLRTGRSGVINTARDFSCSLVTARGELLSVSEGFPIHMLRGADLMAQCMASFHPTLKRGDAFLHNSPYHGNSHAADHTIIVPVVDDAGGHRFTVLAKAHLADCGNALPTTYMGAARDVYAEGAPIFPATKIQENYRHVMDVVRLCQMRIRVPEQWWGDYLATLGAARVAEREILKLGAEYGWDRFHALERAWFDYSEARMIAAIRKLPAGTAVAENMHDPFPGTPAEGVRIKALVGVDPEAARIIVDLRNNPDNMPCGLNLTEGTATSGALCGVFDSIGPGVPANAGSYRRIDVRLREGCIVGIPRHPTSCSVATTNLADRLVNAVQRAFGTLGAGVGMADASGSSLPPSCGVVSGFDPRADGAAFINVVILGAGGGPGTPVTDGWLTIACMGNAGMPL